MMNRNDPKNTKKGGFTLIEILVVVSIISLLVSIVLAVTASAKAKAHDAATIIQVHQIQTAFQGCRSLPEFFH